MSKAITTVTTVYLKPHKDSPELPCAASALPDMSVRHRCVGYFRSDKTAMLCVLHNMGDIHENGYYNYAVIERLGEGLYPHPEHVQWFKWDDELNGFIDCETPKGYENVTNFGIG